MIGDQCKVYESGQRKEEESDTTIHSRTSPLQIDTRSSSKSIINVAAITIEFNVFKIQDHTHFLSQSLQC